MANGNGKTIDQDGREVVPPLKALEEQTLAVDLARVEIDQAIATAHKFPRILTNVIADIRTMALMNREAAENCIYALPRGGKPIIGPSIGFANIIQQAWGNNRVAGDIVYVDRAQKAVIARGAFLDLQTNSQTQVPVNRRIVDKNGRIFSDDMIAVTSQAAASIARRNAILNGVPRVIWWPIFEEALKIVRGDGRTFTETRERAIKALAQFGVKPEQIYLVLGLKGEADLTQEHIIIMRGMYQALHDRSATVEEIFDPRKATGRGFDTVENPLGSGQEDPGGDGGEEVEAADENDEPATAAPAEPAQAEKPAEAPKEAQKTETAQAAPAHAQDPTAGLDLEDLAAGDEPDEPAEEEPKGAPARSAYIKQWAAFLARAKSESVIKIQWQAERAIRESLGFSDDEIDQLSDMRLQRIKELAPPAGKAKK